MSIVARPPSSTSVCVTLAAKRRLRAVEHRHQRQHDERQQRHRQQDLDEGERCAG